MHVCIECSDAMNVCIECSCVMYVQNVAMIVCMYCMYLCNVCMKLNVSVGMYVMYVLVVVAECMYVLNAVL